MWDVKSFGLYSQSIKEHTEEFNSEIAHVGIQASDVNTSIIQNLWKSYTCEVEFV